MSATNLMKSQIVKNLQTLSLQIQKLSPNRSIDLLAVSKTKPLQDIEAAYASGQRIFGENYVDEFVTKASEISYPDLKWHFIGHIQTNKARKLVRVPTLHMIESVDSIKLANVLHKEILKTERKEPLQILIQVATGGEDTKFGLDSSQVNDMVTHVMENCPSLKIQGLMGMGKLHDRDGMKKIIEVKHDLLHTMSSRFGDDFINESQFQVSMGTSADYEMAIEEGATRVRLGTTIFGARDYPKK